VPRVALNLAENQIPPYTDPAVPVTTAVLQYFSRLHISPPGWQIDWYGRCERAREEIGQQARRFAASGVDDDLRFWRRRRRIILQLAGLSPCYIT